MSARAAKRQVPPQVEVKNLDYGQGVEVAILKSSRFKVKSKGRYELFMIYG